MKQGPDLHTFIIKAIQRDIQAERAAGSIAADHILDMKEIHDRIPYDLSSDEKLVIAGRIHQSQNLTSAAIHATGALSNSAQDVEDSKASEGEVDNIIDLTMLNHQAVFEKIREIIADALGVEDDQVTPQATLIEDLGAESIDFLDITHRIEQGFNIKIPRGSLFPNVFIERMTDIDSFVQKYPIFEQCDKRVVTESLQTGDIGRLFTIDFVVRNIEQKLVQAADKKKTR